MAIAPSAPTAGTAAMSRSTGAPPSPVAAFPSAAAASLAMVHSCTSVQREDRTICRARSGRVMHNKHTQWFDCDDWLSCPSSDPKSTSLISAGRLTPTAVPCLVSRSDTVTFRGARRSSTPCAVGLCGDTAVLCADPWPSWGRRPGSCVLSLSSRFAPSGCPFRCQVACTPLVLHHDGTTDGVVGSPWLGRWL